MFSWRLVMAPAAVLDYVVAHEVAHLAEMNHSPRFWAVVRRLCPDHAPARDWLRRHGASLHGHRLRRAALDAAPPPGHHIAMIERERLSDSLLPAHERVYRTLRARVMHGQVAPGAALTLRGVAGEFGVSMTPAREAVRRLVAEGALKLSASGRVSTPELTNERIEELAVAPGAARARARDRGRCRGRTWR